MTMPYRIVITPEARDQLDQLYHFIASAAGDADVALRFVDGVIDYIAKLLTFLNAAHCATTCDLASASFRGDVV